MPTSFKYRFGQKEWQDELGLNWYDFGGRAYMPDLVRTPQIDPLAEKFYDLSPQSFLNNNPLSFVDPTGMESDDWKKDASGNMIFDKNLTKENASTQLGRGETYVGDEAEKVENGTRTLYNKDGSTNTGIALNEVVINETSKSPILVKLDAKYSEPQEFGMGFMEYVEGGAISALAKGAKIVKESSLAEKTVVIGEDMANRVIPFAEKYGYKYFKPTGTNPANWMRNQSQWIYRQIKDPTVRIIDIGSKGLEATSKYYKKELEMIEKYLKK